MNNNEEHEQYNERLFEKLVGIYDFVAVLLISVRNRISEILERNQSAKLLDVACGTGTQAIALASKGFEVTGLDLSEAMLRRANSKAVDAPNLHFLVGDATRMSFPDESFDATIISFALHDMPANIRTSVLQEMKRVTKHGGKILVADYAAPIDGLLPQVGRQVSNLFESKYFESFMDVGLNHYLKEAALTTRQSEVLMMGIAQLVICDKN